MEPKRRTPRGLESPLMAANPSPPTSLAAGAPLIYQRRIRRWAVQIVYLAITAFVIFYVVQALGEREYGFGFLNQPAGFDIGNQWLVDFDGTTSSRLTLFFVGVWSTVRVVAVVIALSTVLGVIVGVARLSPSWLLSKTAMLFVELFRNTPLYVQVVIWYAIGLFGLPTIQNVVNIGNFLFLSNRGVALPWPHEQGGFWGGADWMVGVWVGVLVIGGAVALKVRKRLQNQEQATGQTRYPNRIAMGMFAGIAVVSFFLLGMPVYVDRPIIEGTNYAEGMAVRPEFAALTLGLTVYTGAFIAEIVRASIQALPKGQTEAANAIGLSNYQRLTLIILPQALRQMIPSITNQYLNANKNSSIALGVSYFDLFFVANIISNKIGHAVEIFFMIIVTYTVLSLSISLVMNIANSRITARDKEDGTRTSGLRQRLIYALRSRVPMGETS
ncbi:MAG: amino acid ABC transporter permease [Dehalococcoidia bacterium]|nr:amino acid ABC transporter permease [Dehalococcoidia bacterium]